MSRKDRVCETIRREISMILHSELKDPRLGFVTITRVELTEDLRSAKVFFSVLGKEEDYKKTREALNSALGFIRKLIAERINLRFAPEIIFREDRSSEYSVRIQEVLDELKELNEPSPKKSRRLYKKT
jgi:ribosome-binding factor A